MELVSSVEAGVSQPVTIKVDKVAAIATLGADQATGRKSSVASTLFSICYMPLWWNRQTQGT